MTESRLYNLLYKIFLVLWTAFFLMAVADVFWLFSISACFVCLVLKVFFLALERNEVSIGFVRKLLSVDARSSSD